MLNGYRDFTGSFEVGTSNPNVNFSMTAKAIYAYTVYAVDGSDNILATITTESAMEGESVKIPYPRYVNVNGTLYEKAATNKEYRQTSEITENNKVIELTYSATNITNVLYFSEGENISGATATSSGSNMTVRSSNAACGYAPSDITLIKLPAGTYTAKTIIYSNSSSGAEISFVFDQSKDITVSAANNWSENSYEYTLTETTDIKWLRSGSSVNGLDFIYITGAPTNEIVGALDHSTAYSSSIEGTNHKDLSISKGQKLNINFNNHGNGVNNYNNWALRIVNSTAASTAHLVLATISAELTLMTM